MITSLRLTNFKNFADETLHVGPFTVLVGVNASGKSNIRDAFRLLHGIGRGYTIAEIFGGKYGIEGQVEWTPIRGVSNEIIRFGKTCFSLQVELKIDRMSATYFIKIGRTARDPNEFRVIHESLKYGRGTVYTSHPSDPDPISHQDDESQLFLRMAKVWGQRKFGTKVSVRPDKPALLQLHEYRTSGVTKFHRYQIGKVCDSLTRMRFLEPIPDQMRQPTFPSNKILGDGGQNLPTVLERICSSTETRSILSDWLSELTPMDVRDFEFPRDPSGLVHLMIREDNQRQVSAYAASDSTLRFLAILAMFLSNDFENSYFFEEIDNGIHPSRLQLLLDLIEGQTTDGKLQVITTTHSSDLLSMINDDTFLNTSAIARLPDTADAVIRPVSKLHRVDRLRKSQGLGQLLRSGWIEDALVFTEGGASETREEL